MSTRFDKFRFMLGGSNRSYDINDEHCPECGHKGQVRVRYTPLYTKKVKGVNLSSYASGIAARLKLGVRVAKQFNEDVHCSHCDKVWSSQDEYAEALLRISPGRKPDANI